MLYPLLLYCQHEGRDQFENLSQHHQLIVYQQALVFAGKTV